MSESKHVVFKPVTPQRASDYISYQVKEMIFSGVLKPGDRLPAERDLAVTFQTGRMTVREALRMLEESGFVRIKQGADGGTFVRELDGSGMTKTLSGLIKVGNITLRELTDARVAIESIVFESVIENITPEKLAALRSTIEASESQPVDSPQSARPEEAQLINFHLLAAKLCGNGLLRYFHQSLVELSTSFIVQHAPDYVNSEDHTDDHRDILEAIEARDLGRAQAVLKKHLYSVAESIETAITEARDQ